MNVPAGRLVSSRETRQRLRLPQLQRDSVFFIAAIDGRASFLKNRTSFDAWRVSESTAADVVRMQQSAQFHAAVTFADLTILPARRRNLVE